MYRLTKSKQREFTKHLYDSLDRTQGLRLTLYNRIDRTLKSLSTIHSLFLGAVFGLTAVFLVSQYWLLIGFHVAFRIPSLKPVIHLPSF